MVYFVNSMELCWWAAEQGAKNICHAHRVFQYKIQRDFHKHPTASTQQEKSQGHGWEEKHEILATAVEFCNMVCNYRLWYFTGYFAGHWNAAEFSAKSLSSSMSILSQEEFFTRWAGFKARALCLETRCSSKQTINMTSPPTRGFAPISE